MATLAELQTRRDALQRARDSGVLMLREGDKQVTYQSVADQDGVLAALDREINGLSGIAASPRQVRTFGAKGV